MGFPSFVNGTMLRRLTAAACLSDTYEYKTHRDELMSNGSSEEEVSHEQLAVKIARTKDKIAFKKLFDHFAPRLKSYLMKLGLDGQKSEDVAQEVMITLWQKAEKFDPTKAKLSTWMFRVARNKYIDLVRKQKYATVNADDHMSEMVAPEQTDRPLEGKQTSIHIKKAMLKLKVDQRKVIELSFFEELSHAEISIRLGLPLGTVKSRIRSAFQTLRRELGDYK